MEKMSDWMTGATAVLIVFLIVLILTGCAAVDIEAEAVCEEWEQVIPSYDEEADSTRTVLEVKKNQDVYVAVCES